MQVNRQIIKKTLSLVVLLSFTICGNTQTKHVQEVSGNDTTRYYRRHIIICIDRTIQDPNNHLPEIYETLEAMLLRKEMPKGIPQRAKYKYKDGYLFDPYQDELSIFFTDGISGRGYPSPMTGDWARINSFANDGRISTKEMNSLVDSCIIHFQSSFRTSGLSEKDYMENRIKPLFSKGSNDREKVSMSSLLYPLILNQINRVPATEYVILLVSEFKGGGGSDLDKGDDNNLQSLLKKPNSKRYYENFWNHIREIDKPFKFDRSMLDVDYSSDIYKRSPKIIGGELKPIALDETSFEPYPFKVIQKRWGGDKYEISGAQIHITNNPQIRISQIDVEIADSNGTIIARNSISGDIEKKRKDNLIYIGDFNAIFDKADSCEINSYSFSYVVYANIVDDNGNIIIPIVKKKVIAPAIVMASEPQPWILYVAICLVAILIGCALWYIYVRRGKTAIPNIDIDVIPISNTRYMDVENCEVKNFDCWYMEDENDKSRQIRFKVRLTPPNITFAQKRRFIVKFQIEDIDCNNKFTFQPHGKHQDGTQWQLNTLYPLPHLYDMSKESIYEDNIDVDAFLTTDGKINFDIDNILETKLTVSLFMEDNGGERKVRSSQKYYKFIVKPKLRNSNVWVAFDAGTSGSTVAYGITGNWLDKDEINLVQHEIMEAGNTTTKQSAIFPSVVAIPDTSKAFIATSMGAEDYVEDTDFLFGVDAEKEFNNKFQSIKKFLGYKSPQVIIQWNGDKTSEISGQDLAHLLVKGMYSRLENSIRNNNNEDLRAQFYRSSDFDPQRAVVAVPNSYTLNKVQDMVDSVKRLNKFKEIHYLYESEGVMMTYLRKSLPVLKEKQNKTFIVFDMGGATINITAFTLQLRLGKNGNIHKITLSSPAKIGYYVGGDNIDYALIQFVYSIPTIKQLVIEQIQDTKDDATQVSDKDILEHQKQYKNKLIDLARKIKLDWIDVCNGEALADNNMVSIDQFWSFLRARTNDIIDLELPNDPTNEDKEFISRERKEHRIMHHHVYSHISDALSELMKSPKFPSNPQIELILSGRSVLYPNVKDTILKAFKGKSVSLWTGFYKEGTGKFDDQKVKTAVAEGACWYAMYSRDIELKHNYVTSSFGFEDRSNNQKCYHELIENGREFDFDGRCKQEILERDLFDPNINDIKFLQMMGADANKIVQNDIRHKKNLLDEIKPDQIKTAIEKIVFVIDNKGNYDYEVYQRGFEKAITKETTRAKDIQNEIKDENSPAYEFATTNENVQKKRHPSNRPIRPQKRAILDKQVTEPETDDSTKSNKLAHRLK